MIDPSRHKLLSASVVSGLALLLAGLAVNAYLLSTPSRPSVLRIDHSVGVVSPQAATLRIIVLPHDAVGELLVNGVAVQRQDALRKGSALVEPQILSTGTDIQIRYDAGDRGQAECRFRLTADTWVLIHEKEGFVSIQISHRTIGML